LKGQANSPAAKHLFDMNDDAEKLDEAQAEQHHHLVVKILHPCKRMHPDLQTATSFLTARGQEPDIDNHKKLGRLVTHMKNTKDLPHISSADNSKSTKWQIDASFTMHKDCKSHTRATMSKGRGCPISMSLKQKINARSSMEAELVGVNDAMAVAPWVRNFLTTQGHSVEDDITHQDNQSAIPLENNGQRSGGKKTRHTEI